MGTDDPPVPTGRASAPAFHWNRARLTRCEFLAGTMALIVAGVMGPPGLSGAPGQSDHCSHFPHHANPGAIP